MDPFAQDERISAYLDGELTPAERSQFEAELAGNAELRIVVDELRSLRESMQSLTRHRLDDDFAARVLRRAERIILAGEGGQPVAGQAAAPLNTDLPTGLPTVAHPAAAAVQGPAASSAAHVSPASSSAGATSSGFGRRSFESSSGPHWQSRRPWIWSAVAVAVALLLMLSGWLKPKPDNLAMIADSAPQHGPAGQPQDQAKAKTLPPATIASSVKRQPGEGLPASGDSYRALTREEKRNEKSLRKSASPIEQQDADQVSANGAVGDTAQVANSHSDRVNGARLEEQAADKLGVSSAPNLRVAKSDAGGVRRDGVAKESGPSGAPLAAAAKNASGQTSAVAGSPAEVPAALNFGQGQQGAGLAGEKGLSNGLARGMRSARASQEFAVRQTPAASSGLIVAHCVAAPEIAFDTFDRLLASRGIALYDSPAIEGRRLQEQKKAVLEKDRSGKAEADEFQTNDSRDAKQDGDAKRDGGAKQGATAKLDDAVKVADGVKSANTAKPGDVAKPAAGLVATSPVADSNADQVAQDFAKQKIAVPASDMEVVYVEGTQAQILGLVSDLRSQPELYRRLSISATQTPELAQRARGPSRSEVATTPALGKDTVRDAADRESAEREAGSPVVISQNGVARERALPDPAGVPGLKIAGSTQKNVADDQLGDKDNRSASNQSDNNRSAKGGESTDKSKPGDVVRNAPAPAAKPAPAQPLAGSPPLPNVTPNLPSNAPPADRPQLKPGNQEGQQFGSQLQEKLAEQPVAAAEGIHGRSNDAVLREHLSGDSKGEGAIEPDAQSAKKLPAEAKQVQDDLPLEASIALTEPRDSIANSPGGDASNRLERRAAPHAWAMRLVEVPVQLKARVNAAEAADAAVLDSKALDAEGLGVEGRSADGRSVNGSSAITGSKDNQPGSSGSKASEAKSGKETPAESNAARGGANAAAPAWAAPELAKSWSYGNALGEDSAALGDADKAARTITLRLTGKPAAMGKEASSDLVGTPAPPAAPPSAVAQGAVLPGAAFPGTVPAPVAAPAAGPGAGSRGVVEVRTPDGASRLKKEVADEARPSSKADVMFSAPQQWQESHQQAKTTALATRVAAQQAAEGKARSVGGRISSSGGNPAGTNLAATNFADSSFAESEAARSDFAGGGKGAAANGQHVAAADKAPARRDARAAEPRMQAVFVFRLAKPRSAANSATGDAAASEVLNLASPVEPAASGPAPAKAAPANTTPAPVPASLLPAKPVPAAIPTPATQPTK